MKRLLFVSAMARARGPTAAQVVAELYGLSTDFGGVAPGADDPVTREQIEWSTVIFTMESRHQTALAQRFRDMLDGRPIITLGLRDRFTFMQPALIHELEDRLYPHLIAANPPEMRKPPRPPAS